MMVIMTGFIPLSPLPCCLDNDYVGKQPVASKEYCAEYWLKELQENMDKCTGCRDITVENGIRHHTTTPTNKLMKTLWKKEKLLVTSNFFPFSTVFPTC